MHDLCQVHFRISESAADAVANLLVEHGASGIEQRDSDTLRPPDGGLVELIVWMPGSDVTRRVQQVEQLLASLRQMGNTIAPLSWERQDVDPANWVEAYKKYFKLTRVGRLFVIKPSWEEYEAQPTEYLIEIDPGMAFGTGLHASTRLVLRILERMARMLPAPTRVVDIGCGTGILSIAAAKLWPAARVLAVDHDELAVEACRENLAHNQLAQRVTVEHLGAERVAGRYGLVLANLSFEALGRLREPLLKRLDDHGRLVVSGLLAEQANELIPRLVHDLSLEPEYSEEEAGWRAVLLRAPQ